MVQQAPQESKVSAEKRAQTDLEDLLGALDLRVHVVSKVTEDRMVPLDPRDCVELTVSLAKPDPQEMLETWVLLVTPVSQESRERKALLDRRELVDHKVPGVKMVFRVPMGRQGVRVLLGEMDTPARKAQLEMWAQQDHQDFLDPVDPLVRVEILGQLVQKEARECQGVLALRDLEDQRGHQVLKVKGVHQGYQDRKGNGESQVPQVYREHQVYKEKGDLLETEVCPDHLVSLDRLENRVELDHVVVGGLMDQWEVQADRDLQVQLEAGERPDHRDVTEWQEDLDHRAQQEVTDGPARWALPVFREYQV